MKTEYFFVVHHITSLLAELSTWCLEHSGYISCSLLVNPSHTDESWEGRNTCLWIYIYIYIYIYICMFLNMCVCVFVYVCVYMCVEPRIRQKCFWKIRKTLLKIRFEQFKQEISSKTINLKISCKIHGRNSKFKSSFLRNCRH